MEKEDAKPNVLCLPTVWPGTAHRHLHQHPSPTLPYHFGLGQCAREPLQSAGVTGVLKPSAIPMWDTCTHSPLPKVLGKPALHPVLMEKETELQRH